MRKFFTLNLETLKTATIRTAGILALLVGLVGLGLLFLNPIPLVSFIFPIPMLNGLHITQESVQTLLNSVKKDDVLVINASAMAIILSLGIGLLRKGIYNNIKAIGRGLKASPRATLNAPVKLYRKFSVWRNWILEKVEYLQSESAKWKTTFNILKSPYSLLRAMGLSPQMAASFLVAGSVATSGVVVNETILAEKSFSNRDPGVYAASLMGESAPLDIPTEYVEGSNTLRIDLGTTPVRDITIENVSVGTVFANSALPGNETTVVKVGGNPTAENFTATRLEVGTFIYEKSRCKKVTFSNINAHTILIKGNASDGQSVAPSP